MAINVRSETINVIKNLTKLEFDEIETGQVVLPEEPTLEPEPV